MTQMTQADFEARYRADPDPWGYTSSGYERDKYAATLAACGAGPFDHALELGASIGVFSALLAPRCHQLVTIDAAPTAVAQARRRLAARASVTVIEGAIPDDMGSGTYDLIVASEILYYLDGPRLQATVEALERRLATRGRLVAVHWRPPGAERPFDAEHVHQLLHAQAWLRPVTSAPTADYLLDVLDRR
jgi:SAM-dependent methyltransferase